MKLSVVALDYDGTIASDGRMDPSVRPAIDALRTHTTTVIIVTGRILQELRSVAGDLRFVDAIVAENGAVLHFPHSGRTALLGAAPQERFLAELRRRSIAIGVGECVVEAEADAAPEILTVIRNLELPLTLLFNRQRLMILPQGISKASGLREALRALRLSPHNALAIGDAENDHALLNVVEVGLAVEWGSSALQAAADSVLPGSGPAAIGPFLRQLAAEPHMPAPGEVRRHLLLGHDATGRPVDLGIRNRNLLIAGDPRSGKSWIAGLLAEQLILHHYCVCVIDPEGDYRSLESLPGVTVLGYNEALLQPHELIRELRYPDISLVVDLSQLRQPARNAFVTELLPMLAALRRNTGLPHRIIIDEAHYFLHSSDALDLQAGGYTLITYRSSDLHPDVRAAAEAIIVTHASDPYEVQALREMVAERGAATDWADALATLPIDEAILLPGIAETGSGCRRFRVAPRQTRHVRHLQKYLDVPVGERRAFVFTANGAPTGARAATMHEFASCLEAASETCVDGHLRRGDLSRWVAGVFGDVVLATRIRHLEAQYQLAPGIDVRDRLVRLLRDRYMSDAEPTVVAAPQI